MHEINKRQSLYSATRVVFPADVSMAQASAGKERAGRRSRFACDRNVSLFVAAPFLDRSLQRSPPRRPLAIGGFYDKNQPTKGIQPMMEIRIISGDYKGRYVGLPVGSGWGAVL